MGRKRGKDESVSLPPTPKGHYLQKDAAPTTPRRKLKYYSASPHCLGIVFYGAAKTLEIDAPVDAHTLAIEEKALKVQAILAIGDMYDLPLVFEGFRAKRVPTRRDPLPLPCNNSNINPVCSQDLS